MCRDRRGWFLAWPPCHDKRKWPSSSKKLKNGDCTLQNRYVDSASRIHFQWLVTASSLDCHCYKSDSPPAWKVKEKSHKNTKTISPFRNGVWRTHQGRMSPRSCFDFTGVQWHGILRAGKTLLYIQQCKLTETRFNCWRRKRICSNQVSSAFQAAQPETDRLSWCNISNLLLIGTLISHSSFGNGNFESQEHGITHLFQLNWVSIKIRVRINGDCVCDLAMTESKRKTVINISNWGKVQWFLTENRLERMLPRSLHHGDSKVGNGRAYLTPNTGSSDLTPNTSKCN